ncbi:MAG TPA: hypothetical protein VNX88_16870 [Terriglobales bacterium]|jgi:hypothetical protein|nr:hypothetical protein [Terriglobales bacterium]
MKRLTSFILVFATIAVLAVSGLAQVGVLPKGDVRLKQAIDSKFRVGDIWGYKTRPGEEGSRLVVVRVDKSPELGIIVHVAVDSLTWKDCQNNPVPESVPHMPFAHKAVEVSVTKRIATAASLPDYRNGYEEWREAYSKKHAGVYVISVEDAVSVAEKTWRSGIGCE